MIKIQINNKIRVKVKMMIMMIFLIDYLVIIEL